MIPPPPVSAIDLACRWPMSSRICALAKALLLPDVEELVPMLLATEAAMLAATAAPTKACGSNPRKMLEDFWTVEKTPFQRGKHLASRQHRH